MNHYKGTKEKWGANYKTIGKNQMEDRYKTLVKRMQYEARNRGGATSQQFVDPLNRRVVAQELLFEDIEPEDSQWDYNKFQGQQVQRSWTDQHWTRENECAEASTSYKQPQRNNIQKSKLERNYTAAVSQPVEAGKAAIMMQKMGWKGGALGRSGSGIEEPVVPNIAYATKTRGLGAFTQEPQTRTKTHKKLTKRSQQKIRKDIVITNSLKQILQFVRNPAEIQILFDPKLFKNERKLIHSLVNDVINNAMDDVTQLNTQLQFDILDEIYERNHYILGTQSEGLQPNRILCIYKEAPPHVYLVTPYDLRPDSMDENDAEDYSECNENKVYDQINDEKQIITKSDEEKYTKTTKNDTKMTQLDTKLNINEITEDNNMEISGEDILNNTTSKENVIDSVKQCDKPVKYNIIDLEEKTKLNIVNNIIKESDEKQEENQTKTDTETIKEQSIIIIDSDDEQFVNNVINKTNIEKKEINVSNYKDTFVPKVEQAPITKNELNLNATKANEPEISNGQSTDTQDTHADLINQLMEYFREFLESNNCSEFRFLGPFDEEEINKINEFTHSLYYSVYNEKVDTRFKEIINYINSNRYNIYIQNDINDGIVIYKNQHETK